MVRDVAPCAVWSWRLLLHVLLTRHCCARRAGMITKPTRDTIVRLAPPLTLTEAQCLEMVDIIGRTLHSFD